MSKKLTNLCPTCKNEFNGRRKFCSGLCAGISRRSSLADRFWTKVNRIENASSCWEWQGVRQFGYGRIVIARKWNDGKVTEIRDQSHRVAYRLTYGEIPAQMRVLHLCDNPACCRPSHLTLGTDADNVRDKTMKGRQSKGACHGRAKLTEDHVRFIRQSDESQRALAARFGVSKTLIMYIKTGKLWRSLQ